MELFFSEKVCDGFLILGKDEAAHCVRVLRHRVGDEIDVSDGLGTLYRCRIASIFPEQVKCGIVGIQEQWHSHPYRLTMAVCPTKNIDRFEWFVEKAVEIGVDRIVPLEGDRSERRVLKTDRLLRIAHSAAKQSLKAVVPEIADIVQVRDFVSAPASGLKLIACCYDDASAPRKSLISRVEAFLERSQCDGAMSSGDVKPSITVLVGPEGDFSPEELSAAMGNGYEPIHLGESRLRTETAAVVCVTEVYGCFSR